MLLLRSQSLLGQAQHLAAGGGGVRLCDRAAVTLQPAGAHRIGLLRDPRHSRQVADAHSGGAEDTQRVGTDRERDPRFPLDVDGERQQDAGHELRQVSGGRRAAAAPAVAVPVSVGSDLPFCVGTTKGKKSGGSKGRSSKIARSARCRSSTASSPKRERQRPSMVAGRELQITPARRPAMVVRTSVASCGGFRNVSPAGGVSTTYPHRRRPPRSSRLVRALARSSATVMPVPFTCCSTVDHRT